MELPSKNFRWLVNHLTTNGNPLGLSLSRRYSKELEMDDDVTVHFKDIADNRRILEATKDFTPAQKEFAGITEMTRALPDTRIPHLTSRDEHTFTSKKSPLITTPSPRSVQEDSSHESEDNSDHGEENGSVKPVSPRRVSQKIHLELSYLVERRLQRYIFLSLGNSSPVEREATKKICEDTTLDIPTARTFLCLFIELRGQNRVALETRFLTPYQPVSSTRPTLLFRGEYVHKDTLPEKCKVILVPFLEEGHWSLVTLGQPGTARFYDSIPSNTFKYINEVRQHYSLLDGQSRIVKCVTEPNPKANGVFMLLNAIAYLNDLIAQDFYTGSNIPGIRKWLAMVMVLKKIPVNYKF